MKAYLRYVQLFEGINGGSDFRIRLLGSDFAQTMGYDPTGQLLSELRAPVVREATMVAVRRVVERREGLSTHWNNRRFTKVIGTAILTGGTRLQRMRNQLP
jgi:hypothetical protein